MSRIGRAATSWEGILAALVLVALVVGALLSPFFLTTGNLLGQAKSLIAEGLLALGLATVMLTGEIDLSGESILAVTAVIFGLLWEAGVPVWLAAVLALAVATGIGLVNGLLVAVTRLPSLVVTLGSLVALRGFAYVLLEDRPVTGFPEEFLVLTNGTVGTTPVPVPLLIFTVVVALVAILVHLTVPGRWVLAIGSNRATAALSGVPVVGTTIGTFALSGLLAGVAGVLLASRFNSVRADMASGELLAALTIVLLGGISIAGGQGRIVGVALALILVGLVDNGMSLAGISDEAQQLVLGSLLIAAVLVPRAIARLRPSGPAHRTGGPRVPPPRPHGTDHVDVTSTA